ncbi:protein Iojap-related, mitochondrial-like [Neltuma alba]|uniref:protein Iojap-related, mitochondrial-like n=1 Tax=Neltuma alba TaxID=207710 RepID=UPI0010A3E57F|nr:protein Iojap-related, mitochondrial-like [Prosopis alba]
MWAVQRARAFLSSSTASSFSSSLSEARPSWRPGFSFSDFKYASSSSVGDGPNKGLLDLQEIEKVLGDVRADDVKVMPVPKHCDWADYMVIATGRSTWHVKNIAQALIYQAGPLVQFFAMPCLSLVY